MFLVGFLCTDKTGITWSISTIFAIIRLFSGVETFPDSGMSRGISYFCRDSTIESIEISEPVSIIICIHIFHDSSFERIEIFYTCFIHHHRCLLASYPSSTVEYDFFTSKFFFISFEELRNFTKIIRASRDRSLKMAESIFIIISHIENCIFIISIIDHFLEFRNRDFFMISSDFSFCDLLAESDYLISYFHTHSWKLVIIDRSRFTFYIGYFLEV